MNGLFSFSFFRIRNSVASVQSVTFVDKRFEKDKSFITSGVSLIVFLVSHFKSSTFSFVSLEN